MRVKARKPVVLTLGDIFTPLPLTQNNSGSNREIYFCHAILDGGSAFATKRFESRGIGEQSLDRDFQFSALFHPH